jgi:hypothetical protein
MKTRLYGSRVDPDINEVVTYLLNIIGGEDGEDINKPAGGIPCTYELVKSLQHKLDAEATAFIWFDKPSVQLDLCTIWPNTETKRKLLSRCLATVQVKQQLLRLVTMPDLRHTCVSDNNPVFGHLSLYRAPQLFEGNSMGGVGIVCILEPKVVIFNLSISRESIYSIICYWAARIAHRRIYLRWLCDRRFRVQQPEQQAAIQDGIITAARTLRRKLTLEEIVKAAEALASVSGGMSAPTQSERMRRFEGILSDWRDCAPPNWPPKDCKGCLRQGQRACSVARSAEWLNLDAEEVKPTRTSISGAVSAPLGEVCESARLATRPWENLMPHGLQCFVLGCGQYPFVSERVKFWLSKGPSAEELATAIRSTVRAGHFALGNLPMDDQTMQAIVWLLCEYAHNALGVPAQIDLRAHLLQAARGEPALHVLKHFYRDHFFHALEVCFLGHFLLELKMGSGKLLWELVAAKLALPGGKRARHQTVLRLWYVASLLHDVGYGIDVLKGVQTLLRFFGHTPVLVDLSERLAADVAQLSTDLEQAGLVGYRASDRPGEDHGVIAAWHLERLLGKAAKLENEDIKGGPLKVSEYLPAIRAIALHNSRKHNVTFEDNPLAFLLILCDTLQEWNRPRLSFATAPTQIFSNMVGLEGRQDRWDGLLDKVCLNVRKAKAARHFKINPTHGTLRFTLKFNEQIRWNAGVFALWLDASYNLQRLDFKGLPLNIQISYQTPLFYKTRESLPEHQFYRLRDAAHETHMTFLERWFPREQRKNAVTNGAVTWEPAKADGINPATETLTLDLKKLSKQKPLSSSIDEFFKRLAKWKRYNEDREFGGDYAVPDTVI